MAGFFDSIISAISDALGLPGTDQDWESRLREEITLTSPAGNTYTARWSGGTRSVDNNLGRFKFPQVAGERIQDLRAGADIYDLLLEFEGKNNDVNASAFVEELKKNVGNWTIDHPVKGPLSLIWMNTVENMQPVTSGNITTVGSSWIEPLPETEADSQAKAQRDADAQALAANAAASDQFAGTALQQAIGQYQAIVTAVGNAITAVNKILAIVENANILDPRITAIITAINNTVAQDIIDTEALAGQFQALIQIHVLGQSNSNDAITMFAKFAEQAIQDVPTQADDKGVSTTAVTELVVSAAVTAAAQSALIGGPTITGQTATTSTEQAAVINAVSSRSQAVTASNNLAILFENVTNGLDDVQELYEDNSLDNRYFSQSSAYADMLKSVELSRKFLLFSILGLPGERLVTLAEDKLTAQIAHDEYGNIGNEQDETYYLDVLLSTNELMGDDIYWLETGRQVLIYSTPEAAA